MLINNATRMSIVGPTVPSYRKLSARILKKSQIKICAQELKPTPHCAPMAEEASGPSNSEESEKVPKTFGKYESFADYQNVSVWRGIDFFGLCYLLFRCFIDILW